MCGIPGRAAMLAPVESLKVRLFTEGLTASPAARRQIAGGPDGHQPLTLAHYASASGISLELEGDIWVNAPIRDFNPNFVDRPNHRLEFEDERFWVVSGDLRVAARPIPVPAYHDQNNPWGHPYTS